MRLALALLVVPALYAQAQHTFTTAARAEVVAEIELSSPASDWSKPGSEAATVNLLLDGKTQQQIMLFAGPARHKYRVSLGTLAPGRHDVRIERNSTYSAPGTGFQVHAFRVTEIASNHPDHAAYANAPILFARANTVGRFSDIPLLLYCERLKEAGADILQYTVIFSNEDGGTSTRTLMSRWGRATDIEYVYRRNLSSGHAIVQGPGHKDVEFAGKHEDAHPLLMPVTDNNMIAAAPDDSPLCFRLAPVLVDLSSSSREDIMDKHPATYAVMGKELDREGKLRPFGSVAKENISDVRNYLYVDYAAKLTNSALTVNVRTTDGRTFASDLGRSDFAIARVGYVRTTVELPPGTTRAKIASITFDCRVAPPARGQSWPHSGECTLQAIPKVFLLKSDYTPGPSILSRDEPVVLRTGQGVSFQP